MLMFLFSTLVCLFPYRLLFLLYTKFQDSLMSAFDFCSVTDATHNKWVALIMQWALLGNIDHPEITEWTDQKAEILEHNLRSWLMTKSPHCIINYQEIGINMLWCVLWYFGKTSEAESCFRETQMTHLKLLKEKANQISLQKWTPPSRLQMLLNEKNGQYSLCLYWLLDGGKWLWG